VAETSARGPDGSRMRSSQLARCSRDHSSVDRWASMALRSDVVEAAGARSSERRRAWADSSKRASEPDAEPPPRARWSTHYSPRTYVPLTRRLRRAVAVWPEEPGLTPAPTLLRRRHLLLGGGPTHGLPTRRRTDQSVPLGGGQSCGAGGCRVLSEG
jgi:hypothetical protein